MDVKTVTVVGANGTMGSNVSAIFASFGNAKVYMVSRSLEKSERARKRAYQSVRAQSVKKNLLPKDYSTLEKCVVESDIVFESTAEDYEIKAEITRLIAHIADKNFERCKDTIFCTGTSGLSITSLSNYFPERLRPNYMGMHFFNPPYTMTLCEMIPTSSTSREKFKDTMEYCRNVLQRTVVEVKDSPAFLGNRIGFQFINKALQYAEKYKYNGGIDYIDTILGSFTGRNMAPLVTANFVGLDVHQAIVDNLYKNTNDYANDSFILPEFAQGLIDRGNLGRKSGTGLYKKIILNNGINIRLVYDIESNSYRKVINYTFPFVENILEDLKYGNYNQAISVLKENHSQEAEICLQFILNYILYSLKTVDIVGYDIHAADDVMATGFNWCPPLAFIQALGGVKEFEKLCLERMDTNFLHGIGLAHLLEKVEPSKYDFRKFIKAKK